MRLIPVVAPPYDTANTVRAHGAAALSGDAVLADLLHAVMCGGAGGRLWPLSHRARPKPFLKLFGDRSLLQATVDRLDRFPGAVTTIAIGSAENRFLLAEQLRDTAGVGEIVLEPQGRDTAPVAIVAALRARALLAGADGLVLLTPADHVIADTAAFHDAIERAMPAARAGYLVTFGVTPDAPATGYGYIESGPDLDGGDGVRLVRRFHEKPDAATARAYVDGGRHLWNAGIFLFSPRMLIESAGALCPQMLDACRRACDGACRDDDFLRLDAASYSGIVPVSADRAFAERLSGRVAVVPVSMGWCDVGSWRALGALGRSGGIVAGPARTVDCAGTLAISDGPLVVAHGLENTLVVAAGDAVYVAPLDRADEIGEILSGIGAPARDP